jgi:hypothetical protein
MDLRAVGWSGVDWFGLAQDKNRWRALVNAVMNLGFHKMLGNYRDFITGRLSSSAQLHGVRYQLHILCTY